MFFTDIRAPSGHVPEQTPSLSYATRKNLMTKIREMM